MTAIRWNISKSFGSTRAVDDVSLGSTRRDIWAWSNGAGRPPATHHPDIFKPDTDWYRSWGKMSEEKKNHIGYLPEERGLYQDIPVERCLNFMAQLKGLIKKKGKNVLPRC